MVKYILYLYNMYICIYAIYLLLIKYNLEPPDIPKWRGQLNQVNKFDAAFFGVHYKQAHIMDPMCRIILEKSYEAIVDSSNNLILMLFNVVVMTYTSHLLT